MTLAYGWFGPLNSKCLGWRQRSGRLKGALIGSIFIASSAVPQSSGSKPAAVSIRKAVSFAFGSPATSIGCRLKLEMDVYITLAHALTHELDGSSSRSFR